MMMDPTRQVVLTSAQSNPARVHDIDGERGYPGARATASRFSRPPDPLEQPARGAIACKVARCDGPRASVRRRIEVLRPSARNLFGADEGRGCVPRADRYVHGISVQRRDLCRWNSRPAVRAVKRMSAAPSPPTPQLVAPTPALSTRTSPGMLAATPPPVVRSASGTAQQLQSCTRAQTHARAGRTWVRESVPGNAGQRAAFPRPTSLLRTPHAPTADSHTPSRTRPLRLRMCSSQSSPRSEYVISVLRLSILRRIVSANAVRASSDTIFSRPGRPGGARV